MTTITKPRVVKDYEKLDDAIKEQIKLTYPIGFSNNLVKFKNKDGDMVSALPFEAEEKYYLVRMTVIQAKEIIENDDDYDDLGFLKDEAKEEYEDKHSDDVDELDVIADSLADSSPEPDLD